jgi:two-component system sensor histidine kinase KdpD
VAVRHIREVFACDAVVFLPDAAGRRVRRAGAAAIPPAPADGDAPDGAGIRYRRMAGTSGATGLLAIRWAGPGSLDAEQGRLLDAFAAQTSLAVERAQLAEEAERARIRVEAERLRSTLQSAGAHDPSG